MVSSLKRNINNSKNFTKVIKTPKIRKLPVPPGIYMNTCMICSTICHKYCGIADDDDKSRCECIINNYCTKCKGRCHWTEHKKLPYYYEKYMEEKTVTLVELKKK